MIILNNVHDAASRSFVAANGNVAGVTVLDWYNQADRNAWLAAGGTLAISAFPSVLLRHDTYTDNGVTVEAGWDVLRTPSSIAPLPSVGQQVNVGLYTYNGAYLICRQAHTRTNFEPSDTPALFSVWRPQSADMIWIANEPVALNAERIYNGVKYKAIQAHTTQVDWRPDLTPALWSVVAPPTSAWQAGTTYALNAEVTYNGVTYRCRQAHTSQVGWEPPNVLALWLPI